MNAITPAAVPAAQILQTYSYMTFGRSTHRPLFAGSAEVVYPSCEETHCDEYRLSAKEHAMQLCLTLGDEYLATLHTDETGAAEWLDLRAEAAAWAADRANEEAEEAIHIASLQAGYRAGLGIQTGRAA